MSSLLYYKGKVKYFRPWIKEINGLHLINWKRVRSIIGDKQTEKFKEWMKKSKRVYHREGAYFWALEEYFRDTY